MSSTVKRLDANQERLIRKLSTQLLPEYLLIFQQVDTVTGRLIED